ncbi:hypothetical protein [Aureimonas mangrovi]|uniref:hypothetical protein n=1 Tax=Aureimonas mangrovi TaxID=2758041 RepID=UPI00163D89D7|nr:hypothetical protein [Aureimonas mangrovi]
MPNARSSLRTALLAACATTFFAGAPAASAQDEAHPSQAIQRAETCAADYHSRLGTIRDREFETLKAAASTIGDVDAALPGRLIFARVRGDGQDVQRARGAGETLARRQGRTSFARDANTRWIAERIREDLGDYLRQKPTPYLCAGTAAYLTVLRDYAAQGAPSPARIAEDLAVQRETTARSIDAVYAAMRPAPLPRFAPADRPGLLAIEGLRMALDTNLREATSPAVRVASREGDTRISEGQIDPDLPPLTQLPGRRLDSESDIVRALEVLVRRTLHEGHLAPIEAAEIDVSETPRPVLARLAALDRHLKAHPIADPLVRPALETALSDLEILDYLQAAQNGTADPMSGALHATMDAIEAARAETCTCAD